MTFIHDITSSEKNAKDALAAAKEQAQKSVENAEQKEKESLKKLEEELSKEQQDALLHQKNELSKKNEEVKKMASAEAEAITSAASTNSTQAVEIVLKHLGV